MPDKLTEDELRERGNLENHTWRIGDRVSTNPDLAWVYEGTEKANLMGRYRLGTVIKVPDGTARTGVGTLLVCWESLTEQPLKRCDWWTHSNLILRAE
jgi:hypothetical protein